jgi:hypothetical protein
MRVRLLPLMLSRRGGSGGGGGCEIIDFGSSDFATLHFTLRPQRTHKNTHTLGPNQIRANASCHKYFLTFILENTNFPQCQKSIKKYLNEALK